MSSTYDLSRKFVSLRKQKGITQKEVADFFGCSQSQISKLESFPDEKWKLKDIRKYAVFLNVTVNFVLYPSKDSGHAS